LIEQGLAYYCFCTEEELEQNRKDALENHTTPKYNRKCLNLTKEEIQDKISKNIPHVIRVKMPDNRMIT
jgi:glutamyl/glutaminyl-tRNA synthetase